MILQVILRRKADRTLSNSRPQCAYEIFLYFYLHYCYILFEVLPREQRV